MILEAWERVLRIAGDVMSFSLEKVTRGPPPKASSNPLFAVLWFGCFFRVFSFLDFCDFECPETPFWLQFGLLFGSPGPL